ERARFHLKPLAAHYLRIRRLPPKVSKTRRHHGSEAPVAERIQPLSDVGPVRHVPAQPRISARNPSFAELVHAHLAWWQGRHGGTSGPAAEAEYDATHAAFENAHGEIVRAYWCADIPSAVALTEKKRLSGRVSSTFRFHRETDWATKNAPDVAAELHRCDA